MHNPSSSVFLNTLGLSQQAFSNDCKTVAIMVGDALSEIVIVTGQGQPRDGRRSRDERSEFGAGRSLPQQHCRE